MATPGQGARHPFWRSQTRQSMLAPSGAAKAKRNDRGERSSEPPPLPTADTAEGDKGPTVPGSPASTVDHRNTAASSPASIVSPAAKAPREDAAAANSVVPLVPPHQIIPESTTPALEALMTDALINFEEGSEQPPANHRPRSLVCGPECPSE